MSGATSPSRRPGPGARAGEDGDPIKRLVPWLVAVAFFMESLDTTILNTAVPTVAAALKIAPLSMKSVLSSYTLSVAVFIPVSGWVADRFGTRRVFSAAIGTFTLGSLLCGLSQSIHMLVFCRILQGAGGAMMVPVGRLTMVRTFPRSELVRAMAYVAIPSLIGPMLGPLAGGLIVKWLHWRLIFLLNLPFGVVGLYLVYRNLPDYRAERSDPLDVVGLILFGAGVALLSYLLEVFGEHFLSGAAIAALLVLSLALLFAYGRHAVTTPHPLLRLGLLAHSHAAHRDPRQLHHAHGRRRHAVPAAAAVPGRPRLQPGPVRPADPAAVGGVDEPAHDHAASAAALRLPPRAAVEHAVHRRDHRQLRAGRARARHPR